MIHNCGRPDPSINNLNAQNVYGALTPLDARIIFRNLFAGYKFGSNSPAVVQRYGFLVDCRISLRKTIRCTEYIGLIAETQMVL